MPRTKTTSPALSHEKGQRSLQLDDAYYLNRILPAWRSPDWVDAATWRAIVQHQPLAMACRETLIANLVTLDWKIDARDSNQRDELKADIKYYTKLFEDDGNYDWITRIEWLAADHLDLPFGGVCEMGREGDSPDGKVLWLLPIDGGTCFPTLNSDWPVGQALQDLAFKTVYFPAHAINRLYMSPRTNIRRMGWGQAPPEKIYLALALLDRGDVYYANLLLDTPEAGILDLGDMSTESAQSWIQSWRKMLTGIDPFKIPVLYEHEIQAKWIPFTRSPTELMFDKATLKYASILCAGYGMSISDIGVQAVTSGGETLAGSIRQERKGRKTGFGRAKKAFEAFFNRILPEELKFGFIDLDDEVSVALGRARLANATAWNLLVTNGTFSPDEARLQMIADGLITIAIPEKAPGPPPLPAGQPQERPGLLGRPIAPSQGGWGEKKSEALDAALAQDQEFAELFKSLNDKWELLEEPEQNEALSEIQSYLDGIMDNNDTIEEEYGNTIETAGQTA